MTIVNLNNLQGIPKEFINELESFNSLFKENILLENLLRNYSIANLIERINEYCLKNQIFGYHYTKAIPDEIQKTGLTCRNGEDIRYTFMINFGYLFTEDEKLKIKKAWANFDCEQKEARDNRLFFNFTTCALEDFSAKPLLTNFGGEQVYMPIQELKEIGDKIKRIGKPLILKCKLDPNNINTFYKHPWGRIAVSTYHCQINKEAQQDDQDGYQKVDVAPQNVDVIEYDEKKKYR
jgi:hypothetical protein